MATLLITALLIKTGRLDDLILDAAAVSAVIISPDAALDALRNTYRDEIIEPEPESSPTPPPLNIFDYDSEPPDEEAPMEIPDAAEEFEVVPLPDIPKEYQGELKSEDFSGYEGGPSFSWNKAWIRNYTSFTQAELLSILDTPTPITDTGTDEPQVLIYHTHATESYCPYDADIYDTRYNWRSTDVTDNMVSVGKIITDTLRSRGIAVIHDTYLHDYPSYNGSYSSSYNSIVKYLEQYPSISVVLDVHRDAIERDNALIVKPVTEYEGEKYAQIMVISNCDDGSGLIPNWRENLRFAAAFTDCMEQIVPSITRPILFSHRKYNQQLSTGALLLEFGSHANTLDEAKRSAVVVGNALADLMLRAESEEID